MITLPGNERRALLDRVREHPALAGAEGIAMPYVTRCVRADLK